MQRPVRQHVAFAKEARAQRDGAPAPDLAAFAVPHATPRGSGARRTSRQGGQTTSGTASGVVRLSLAAVLALGLAACALPHDKAADATEATAQANADTDNELATLRAQQAASFHADEPYHPADLPQLSLTPPMLYELLAAEIAVQRQQLQTAYNSFAGLAAQTRDARLARRATEIALGGRAFEQALTSARLWAELDPTADEPKQAVEALLLATSRLSEAEPLLVQRLAKARQQDQIDAYYGQLQRTLTRIEDRKGAWALLQRISQPDLALLSARRARAVMAEVAGDRSAATEEALAAQQLAPDDAAVAIHAARLLQGQGDDGSTRAAKLLDGFVRSHPDEQIVRLALARVYLAERQLAPARSTLDAALKQDPQDPQALFLSAQTAYQATELDLARTQLLRYTDLPETIERDNASAWIFLSQIAEDQKKPAEAIQWLERIDGGEMYLPAVSRRALLLARGGDVAAAQQLLNHTEARSPQERQALVSAQASVLREAQRFQEAFTLLDKALAANPDNPELLYDQAMAAEKVGRLDALEKSLRRLIELQPDSAHAHNALGYTFADRSLHLEEALQLIEKANELTPDDPHIIDSLGWVHFRLGNTELALKYLRQAYEMKPDVEVAAHLGEVLWRSGAQEEAMKVWREASGREPMNEVLRGTLARLNVSL